MGKKTKRDPAAPKRNLSAYLLFQNEMREEFKNRRPDMSFGQLAKYTSAMYAQLPPEEKDVWVKKAQADKLRYEHELSTYRPPQGYNKKGVYIVDDEAIQLQLQQHHVGKNGRKKTQKDPNAPKRNLSAYLLYQNAQREQFKRENPGMTFGQLAKYTSHMYKSMLPEEKATWEAKAARDKARYDAEIAQYIPPAGHDAKGHLIETHRGKKKRKHNPKDPSAPKRASGAYVFFTNDMRPQINAQFPGIKFVELGKVLGERWRALTPEQKKKYDDLAAADKQRYVDEKREYDANHQQHAHQRQPDEDEAAAVHEAVIEVEGHHDSSVVASYHQQHLLHQQATAAATYGVPPGAYDPYGHHHHQGAHVTSMDHHHHDPYAGYGQQMK